MILKEAVPGTIRNALHFISFLRRFNEYLKHRMRTKTVLIESPAAFLRDINNLMHIDRKPLRFLMITFFRLISVFSQFIFFCLFGILISSFA